MSKQDEAGLILKLYELRREETLRKARDWYFRDFHPQSVEDFTNSIRGEDSGYLRMVISYWDMAAALVNHGAIDLELFNDANGEHISVFARIEPVLQEVRALFGPHFLRNLEHLVDSTPHGRERTARAREMTKSMAAEAAAARN